VHPKTGAMKPIVNFHGHGYVAIMKNPPFTVLVSLLYLFILSIVLIITNIFSKRISEKLRVKKKTNYITAELRSYRKFACTKSYKLPKH